jgi:hypothetical protein
MKCAGRWVVAAGFGLTALVAAGEVPTKLAKPCPLPGIPDKWAYRPDTDRSALVSAQGSPGVLLETALARSTDTTVGEPASRVKLRYFQMPVRGLFIDHCSITRVVLTIRDDGQYLVSFRADQHVKLSGAIGDPVIPLEVEFRPLRSKEVNQLKRNEFTVRFRLLGGSGPRDTLAPVGVGRPVLVKLAMDPFWVQRGEPYDFFAKGSSVDVKDYFSLVDLIEVDFSYR